MVVVREREGERINPSVLADGKENGRIKISRIRMFSLQGMVARPRSGPGSNPARPFETIDDNLELRSPLVAFPRRQHDHHFARGRALHRDPIFNPFGPPPRSIHSSRYSAKLCTPDPRHSPPFNR